MMELILGAYIGGSCHDTPLFGLATHARYLSLGHSRRPRALNRVCCMILRKLVAIYSGLHTVMGKYEAVALEEFTRVVIPGPSCQRLHFPYVCSLEQYKTRNNGNQPDWGTASFLPQLGL